ncbi:MAG: DMT family transporter [Candidatus Hydrogenedentes bacterium]|nr:DMT family transporter [Candidatus Hydrogenedentota bacterium]
MSAARHTQWSLRAAVALALASIGWSLAPIFIRMCSAEFDPVTQSFLRYVSGSALLSAICLVRWRDEFLRALRSPGQLVGISALNVFMQYIWTVGCYGTPATTAQLIIKLSTVFVIVLAYLLYHEERAVIRDPRYLGGTAVSLIGLVFVLMQDAHSLIPVLNTAALLLMLMSICWAIYAVWGKHLAWKIHPVPMFGVLSLHTMVGLGMLTLILGNHAQTAAASSRVVMIAMFSGFISIGIAHPAFQYAQRELGSAFCTSANLINPLFTFLFALALLPGEHMQPVQWLGAALLMAGMGLVMLASQRHQTKDAQVQATE